MSEYNGDPIPFDVGGKIYQAKLSLAAVLVMQQESGLSYPEIQRHIYAGNLKLLRQEAERIGYAIPDNLPDLPVDDSAVLSSLFHFCTACLLWGWPGLTTDTLFDALDMTVSAKYIQGIQRLNVLALDLLKDHTPAPVDDDAPEGDAKNAKSPIPTPGVGAPSPATSTASSDSATPTRSGRSRSKTTGK